MGKIKGCIKNLDVMKAATRKWGSDDPEILMVFQMLIWAGLLIITSSSYPLILDGQLGEFRVILLTIFWTLVFSFITNSYYSKMDDENKH